mmetsp:Transcript_58878/g.166081  ORF Transcript_58878/g.166081 Transcript_58878/m.166081 type:complete len:124 (+) Transcript_58878:85-456(+)
MSTRTPAVPDDFPHFEAWYGQTPNFEHARFRGREFHCREQVFRLRQLVDARYYMHWHYSDSGSYGSTAYFEALEDWMRCRRIRKIDATERPNALRLWFTERNKVNTIWEYRDAPAHIGKHQVY